MGRREISSIDCVETSWEHTGTYVTEGKVWNRVELCTQEPGLELQCL